MMKHAHGAFIACKEPMLHPISVLSCPLPFISLLLSVLTVITLRCVSLQIDGYFLTLFECFRVEGTGTAQYDNSTQTKTNEVIDGWVDGWAECFASQSVGEAQKGRRKGVPVPSSELAGPHFLSLPSSSTTANHTSPP